VVGESGVRVVRVPWNDRRAVELRHALDADLTARYLPVEGDDPPELVAARARALAVHSADIVATLLAVEPDAGPDAGPALGHVMLRRLDGDWELKRLFVADTARGRGIGRALVREVVDIATAGGAGRVILQTGDMQPESIALYRSHGFTPIPVYEPYVATMPDSRCFELVLR
jgi:GNAT superfamily N-acetyltransferase